MAYTSLNRDQRKKGPDHPSEMMSGEQEKEREPLDPSEMMSGEQEKEREPLISSEMMSFVLAAYPVLWQQAAVLHERFSVAAL